MQVPTQLEELIALLAKDVGIPSLCIAHHVIFGNKCFSITQSVWVLHACTVQGGNCSMVQRSAACKVFQLAREDRQAFFMQHNGAILMQNRAQAYCCKDSMPQ